MKPYCPKNLAQCHNVFDLRELARSRLPGSIFPYLIGAAEDEITLRRNTEAFDDVSVIPQVLVDVSKVSTATRILGQDIEWPVYCSPTGAQRLFHPEGELAAARAATKAGTIYGLSCVATCTLEEVAAAAQGPKLFQLYIFKDRDLTRELIARSKRAGYKALCLTVDAPVRGNCEREQRTGITPPLTLRTMARLAMSPGWLFGQARKGKLTIPHIAQHTGIHDFVENSKYVGSQLDQSVSWKDVREVIDLWGGPFAIKGMMAADDARRAADVGATAVVISNHGGRQVDGAAASFEVLPDIVNAVGDRVEVILDSGIRRGVHVLKALARGAKACTVGRAYLFGLAADGEAGVTRALQLLRTELVRAMQLSGCTDVRTIDRNILA